MQGSRKVVGQEGTENAGNNQVQARVGALSQGDLWGMWGNTRFTINLSLEKKTSGNFGELVGLC